MQKLKAEEEEEGREENNKKTKNQITFKCRTYVPLFWGDQQD